MAKDPGTKRIEEKIRKLPPKLRKEVEEFIESLVEPPEVKKSRGLELKWRGALRDLRGKYTSVELQHRIREEWGDSCILRERLGLRVHKRTASRFET
jgi:Protein of unknown function (DUF2281)